MQQKTKRPVQFELMTEARQTLQTWLNRRGGSVFIQADVSLLGDEISSRAREDALKSPG